jgi:hypothetical protein
MATFCICLSTTSPQLLVELPAANIDELVQDAATARFLAGIMAQPDENGWFRGVMIQTSRIQCAYEVDCEHVLYGDRP